MTRDPQALLAHARHELRTPLGAMIGYSEMILEEPDLVSSDLASQLQAFQEKSRGLLEQVQELLSGGRLEADGSNLSRIGADARLRLLPAADDMLQRGEQMLSQGQSTDAVGDFERIAQASRLFRDMLDLELAFDPRDHPAEPATSTPTQADAQGVGLPTRHAGVPDVPEPPTARRLAWEASSDPEPIEERDFVGNVLVVDDNAFNRELLARGLWRQGRHFAVAPGGKQALDMLEHGSFDLVLLDLMMPEMNGFEVLDRIKRDPKLRDIPVIMVSALDQMDGIVRCIEMGAEDYLPKPFDPVLLEARVNACLEKKRLRDMELEYLRNVDGVIQAAAAVESGSFDPAQLDTTAARQDALGQLARVFQHMAREVRAREDRLKQEVQQLRFEVDEVRKAKQVQEITETDFFQQLQERAETMRKRSRK